MPTCFTNQQNGQSRSGPYLLIVFQPNYLKCVGGCHTFHNTSSHTPARYALCFEVVERERRVVQFIHLYETLPALDQRQCLRLEWFNFIIILWTDSFRQLCPNIDQSSGTVHTSIWDFACTRSKTMFASWMIQFYYYIMNWFLSTTLSQYWSVDTDNLSWKSIYLKCHQAKQLTQPISSMSVVFSCSGWGMCKFTP